MVTFLKLREALELSALPVITYQAVWSSALRCFIALQHISTLSLAQSLSCHTFH